MRNSNASAVWFGLICGLIAGMFIGAGIISSEWKAGAIERGLAQYCPLTGEWAWVGECDK